MHFSYSGARSRLVAGRASLDRGGRRWAARTVGPTRSFPPPPPVLVALRALACNNVHLLLVTSVTKCVCLLVRLGAVRHQLWHRRCLSLDSSTASNRFDLQTLPEGVFPGNISKLWQTYQRNFKNLSMSVCHSKSSGSARHLQWRQLEQLKKNLSPHCEPEHWARLNLIAKQGCFVVKWKEHDKGSCCK